jgi:conjugal transfer mating pair stabilization protein TraG
MAYEITTWGGGEILKGVFNALAMGLNSHTGSLYAPLLRLGLLLGSFTAVCLWFFRDQARLLSHWFLPALLGNALLFGPSVTVWIIDPVLKVHHKVDHVPLGLAAFSSHLSQVSKVITEQVEQLFSLPDDLKYQKTGTLFASNLIQKSKTFRITNEDIAGNMREFVCQCVMMDAMLGRKYGIEDLRHTVDLWKLVSEKPSSIRSILWKDPQSHATEIITCKQAVQKLNSLLGPILDQTADTWGKRLFGTSSLINAKAEFLQYLPVSFGYFFKSAQSAQDILKQQMMIHSLVEGVETKSTALGNSPNWAARRAYLQQKMTYDTLGEMVLDFLPILKGVLEAVGYGLFLFLIPLLMLPQGYRFLLNWGQLLLWLQMWPPLYAILNFVMNLALQSKTLGLLTLSNQAGMTIAASAGVYQLHSDMASLAGYLSLSIPFLGLGLVQGIGSFIHMTSSLTGVTQGSASALASETLSGNYSVGNISEGTVQIANKTLGQVNTQSAYKSGSFQVSSGRVDQIANADGSQTISVASSHVPVSYNVASTQSSQLMEQSAQSYQTAQSQSESAGQNLSNSYRKILELAEHQSHQENLGKSWSVGEQSSENRSLTQASRMIRQFAESHNMNTSQAADLIAQASAGGKWLGIGGELSGNLKGNAQNSKTFEDAKNLSQNQEFQKAIQESVQSSQNRQFSEGDDQGKRLSHQIAGSYEQAQHHREEASKSYQDSQNYQKQASQIQSQASTINANFTQQALEAIANLPADTLPAHSHPSGHQTSGKIGMRTVAFWAANRPEVLAQHMERYAESQGLVRPPEMHSPAAIHQRYESLPQTEGSHPTSNPLETVQNQAHASGIQFDSQTRKSLQQEVESHRHHSQEQIAQGDHHNEKKFQELQKQVQRQNDKNLLRLAAKEAGKNAGDTLYSPIVGLGQLATKVKTMIEGSKESSEKD